MHPEGRGGSPELTSVDDVRAVVMEGRRPLPPRRVLVRDALGLVLAAPVTAVNDVPPFVNSAMDGYALRAGDLDDGATRLRVVDQTMAGDTASGLGAGEAIRIMTGAPMPSGADSVARLEETVVEADSMVIIERSVPIGANVRLAGEDIAAGAIALETGTRLGAGQIALLASVGVVEVEAYPRARVGVLSTGDELATDAAPLKPGRIRDANRPALLALVAEAGFEPVDLGVVGDDEDDIARGVLDGLARVDALVTSGGVSAGDRDLVAVVMERLAGSVRSFDVAMRPGRPFSFAEIGGSPVFGLAGNPAAAMIGFELFVRPAVRAMAGHREAARPLLAAVADEALTRRSDGKLHFVRVAIAVGDDGRLHVRSAGRQNPHMLTTSGATAGLVVLPDGVGLDAGDQVEVMVLDWDQVTRTDGVATSRR